jgi:hypothetical protein
MPGIGTLNNKKRGIPRFINDKPNRKYNSPIESLQGHLYSVYCQSMRRHSMEMNLTFEDFKVLISQDCYYCGRPPSQKLTTPARPDILYYNGIDRVNNLLPYSLGNCVTACKFCNGAKSNLSLEEFYNNVKKLYDNLVKKELLEVEKAL